MSKTLEPFFIPNVRASFIEIFQKGQYQGETKSKYEITLIFDKSEHSPYVDQLIEQADELIEDELDGEEPEDRFMCIKDDDTRTKKGNRPEYRGHYTLKAASANRPIAVDQMKKPVLESDNLFYSGCRVNVKVSLWANDGKNGASVGCNILVVQFAGNDEPLGEGSMSFEEAVDDMPDVSSDDPFGDEAPKKKKKDKKKKKS